MLETRILTGLQEIDAIGGEWRQLHARIDGGPFANYDLFSTWWRLIGKLDNERMLHVVTGRENGRLVGVVPLTIRNRKGMRIMQAAGFRAYNCDMVAETPAIMAALWRAAYDSPHYDFASIRDVYPQSSCYQALMSFAKRRDMLDAFIMRFEHKSSEEWKASLSSATRAKYRRPLRHMEEAGPVKFEVYTGGPLPKPVVEKMVNLKTDWARKNKKDGLFYQPNVLTYYTGILEKAAQENGLFLTWVTCGNDLVAANQGFIHQGVVHMPFWTYNPDYARYSPGNVAVVHSIIWAIDHGLQALDLRLGESQIKARYCNVKNHSAEFTFSRTAKGKLYEKAFYALRGLWRSGKKTISRVTEKESD